MYLSRKKKSRVDKNIQQGTNEYVKGVYEDQTKKNHPTLISVYWPINE